MNRRLLTWVSSIVFLAGLLFSAGWAFWDTQTSGDTWIIDCTEQVVTGTSPEQEVQATFHLKNRSSHPFRILGSTAC